MKNLIKTLGRRAGYRITRINPRVPQGFCAERIRLIGNPKTIVDVGVAAGTFEYYDAFPDAHIVLVEPLPQVFEKTINHIKSKYKQVTLLPYAAGAEAGTSEINLEKNAPHKSSLMARSDLTREASGTEKHTIKLDRLDRLLTQGGFEGPFAIKIDTEGYELNVVKGLTDLLPQVDFIIAEVSVSKRFEESYSFAEFIGHMASVGFEVSDLLSFSRPDKVGTRFMDLAFKRHP